MPKKKREEVEITIHFDDYHRESFIKQIDLVLLYYERTSITFSNIEVEADSLAEEWYESYSGDENTDPAMVAERAEEFGIELYQTLSMMKYNHLYMTIAMLSQMWEQQLISHINKDIRRHYSIDKALSIQEIINSLKLQSPIPLNKIFELRDLTNVIKHGDGKSADKLRESRPDLLINKDIDVDLQKTNEVVLTEPFSLNVENEDLFLYIDVVKDFWYHFPNVLIINSEL